MRSPSVIRAESLTDQVYSLLEREIVEGRMKPGERIREKELAQRLGISRTPIREALLKLEMGGIVVCNSRRSYNVRTLTADDISEVFEILGILEGAAVASIQQKITEEDLALLRVYNERMAETAQTGDFHAFGAWNEKFHDVLLTKSRNHTLLEVCDSIRRRIYVFPVRPPAVSYLIDQSVREHLEIIRLAKSNEPAALGAYFRDVHWNYRVHLPYVEEVFSGSSTTAGNETSQTRLRPEKVRGLPVQVAKRARRTRMAAIK
jgi:DNA-binding GntR family transcriptional regulator